MGKQIGENISKYGYSEKSLDHAKQFATDSPKTASKNSKSNW